MTKQTKPFNVGDRVAYNANFVRTMGHCHDVAKLRGTVRAVQAFGQNQLVTIAWDNYRVESDYHDDGLGRVIARHLRLMQR